MLVTDGHTWMHLVGPVSTSLTTRPTSPGLMSQRHIPPVSLPHVQASLALAVRVRSVREKVNEKSLSGSQYLQKGESPKKIRAGFF